MSGSLDRGKDKYVREDYDDTVQRQIGVRAQGSFGMGDTPGKNAASMQGMDPSAMLRFLEEEEALLKKLHGKISDELNRLQVEEHVFLQTLKILRHKQFPANKAADVEEQNSEWDQELIDAMKEALNEKIDYEQCRSLTDAKES